MKKVLIVEDDPMVASLNEQFVEKHGDLDVAGNVRTTREATSIIKLNQIDLILLDVYLPGETGLEFLKRLQLEEINIPIILITAANNGEVLQEVLHYGVIDYLVKPFTYKRFQKALDRFLALTVATKQAAVNTQEQLDIYFNQNDSKNTTELLELPKGLSRPTLTKVYRAMQTFTSDFSNEQLAHQANLSRISTKKYIRFLVEIQLLEENLAYLEIGRPLAMYQINPEKEKNLYQYIRKI